jgi:hypothetical protein
LVASEVVEKYKKIEYETGAAAKILPIMPKWSKRD